MIDFTKIPNPQRLRTYWLKCGYVQTRDVGDANIQLWMEHCAFHVRGTRISEGPADCRLFWDVFDSWGQAQVAYRARIKYYKAI
jgi:hypothetical protein